MVTVGAVAFILNVMILSVVLVSEKLLSTILRSFSVSSLRNNRKSPVVHDSDVWLPFLPAIVFKYFKYPWMLITVMIGFLLVASELVAEFGVSASKTCAPAIRTGPVLNASDIRDRQGTILLTTCIGLESIDFLDEFTRISEGFPVHPSADTCMPCVDPNARNIVSNCSLTWWRKYDPFQLEIFLQHRRPGGIITKKFREAANPEKEYIGYGDYISNNGITSSFLFSFSETNDVQYVEYNGQAHLRKLGAQVQNMKTRIFHETTQSPVNVYNISCGESILSRDNLARAAQMYRTCQLLNFVLPLEFNETTQKFSREFTNDSIYRAVWATKLLDGGNKQGNYFVHTECGRYEWVYLSPLLVSLSLLVFLMIVSSAKQYSPSARAHAHKFLIWHLQAQIKQIEMRPFSSSFGQNISTFFKSLFDRMVHDEKTCEGDVMVVIGP